jgi:C4-dicarboxylate-specific signal transduction histidine kinase
MMTSGNAGLLLTKDRPDSQEEHAIFSEIVADGQRVGKIIGGVRTMFKESTHDRQPLSLNTVVRDVLSTVELDLRLQRVMVKRDLDSSLPSILADSGQMHQVFLNLITNAMEAMSEVTSRPGVLMITSGVAAGSSDIVVTVEDTGVGIPGNDSRRIFDPFFSTKVAGSGVGLTVCQVVIKGHGGRLEVHVNKPHGTIFRVILPAGGEE